VEAAQPPAFEQYRKYQEELRAAFPATNAFDPDTIAKHLDGLAYDQLRRLVPLSDRRKASTFFTGSALRARLVAPYKHEIRRGAAVIDPACGVGDLLIAAIYSLPKSWTTSKIAEHATSHFSGSEIIPTLAEVAQERLSLAVQSHSRHRQSQLLPPAQGHVKVANSSGLEPNVLAYADIVLLNPPFGRVRLPKQSWGQGLATEAAPFTLSVVKNCKPGARIAAILPDALRSGPRYARWREEVRRFVKIEDIEIVGEFDRWTSIDVFIARLKVESGSDSDLEQSQKHRPALGTLASVHVGDVVPHRHLAIGPEVPYLTVATVPVGGTINRAPTRRFPGRTHSGPLVVARRTSAAGNGGRPRLQTSVVPEWIGAAAVENHLLVIKPKNNSMAACEMLANSLRDISVTEWLNTASRTRHLTCQVVRDIPLDLLAPKCIEQLGLAD